MASRSFKVTTLVTVISIVALVILAVADLLIVDESVPIVVYGIIGGIALGADSETIPAIFGVRKKDE